METVKKCFDKNRIFHHRGITNLTIHNNQQIPLLSLSFFIIFMLRAIYVSIPPTWDEPIRLVLIGLIINRIMIGASLPLIKRTARTLNE